MPSGYIREHIQNTIEFVEENIHDAICIDDISDNVYISKYHLQRLFRSVTGKGLSEYARARKLTESLYDLMEPCMTIGSISMKYGFEYEQSYTRAFKAEFGLSPSEYRKSPRVVNITPRTDISLISELENSVIIKPFHVYRPSFTIGGILNKVEIEENEKNYKATNVAVDFFYNRRSQVKNAVNPDVYYGYTYWDKDSAGFTYYLTGLEISNPSELPDGFSHITVPGSNYSVFRFIGFFPPEKITWRNLVDIWIFKDDYFLKNKGIDFRKLYQFEYIDMSLCRDDCCELDLYIPII